MRAAVPAALALLLAGCLEPPRRPDAGPCDPFDAGTCETDETCQFVSFSSFGCVPEGDVGDQDAYVMWYDIEDIKLTVILNRAATTPLSGDGIDINKYGSLPAEIWTRLK